MARSQQPQQQPSRLRKPQSLRAQLRAATPPSSLSASSAALLGISGLGLSAALLVPLSTLAQTASPAAPVTSATPAAPAASAAQAGKAAGSLPVVTVQEKAIDPNPNAEVGVPYKAKTSADSRHTRPLAETPQTIQVLTKASIDDSGFTDLKKILSAQPGITLGTGENGNAFGDRYIIRGQEARSDVFVDGLRDPGMSTRESFAIEQLEISKGPNSSFAGRGTAGGAINAITKQATLDYDFARLSAGFGTDSYGRFSTDINHVFTDQTALRANLLWDDEGVPDRAPSKRSRKGVALSGVYEASKDLSITLDYYGLRARDKYPDLGTYLVGAVPDRVPAKNVPTYAQDNDFLTSDTDTLTARIKWKLSPTLSINSLTRYGQTSNAYGTTGAAYAATRYNGTTGAVYASASIDNGHTGWQEVDYFAHQTNLRWDTKLGNTKNEFVFGVEYTDHKVVSGNYAVANSGAFNCKTTAGVGANNGFCIFDQAGNVVNNLTGVTGRTYTRRGFSGDWHVKTTALSVMDTIDLTDQWTLFAGLRADHFDLSLQTRNNTTEVVTGNYSYQDTLVNGNFGITYKISPAGMVYFSVATSQDINGGEPDSGTNSGYGGTVVYNGQVAGAKPETARNIEIGTKWNVLDDKLLATAAIFQTTKDDVMEGANYDTVGTFNTGSLRVKGVEIGLQGNITPQFTVQAGISWLNSEILKSVTAASIGKPLANFANRTASIQGKYQFTDAFAFGAAARYESDRCGGQPDTAAGFDTLNRCTQPIPSFAVYDLFATYRVNKNLDLRVNVQNVGNKDYYTAGYRAGFFVYKGDARSTRVTVNYEF